MSNKFQKSVLERLEQEATVQRQKKKTEKLSKEHQPEARPPLMEEFTEEAVALKTTDTEIKKIADNSVAASSEVTAPSMPDIGDYIRKEIPRIAKNKTFYLDSDVIETIKHTSKAQGVTDSKLVNDILRRVLGL